MTWKLHQQNLPLWLTAVLNVYHFHWTVLGIVKQLERLQKRWGWVIPLSNESVALLLMRWKSATLTHKCTNSGCEWMWKFLNLLNKSGLFLYIDFSGNTRLQNIRRNIRWSKVYIPRECGTSSFKLFCSVRQIKNTSS